MINCFKNFLYRFYLLLIYSTGKVKYYHYGKEKRFFIKFFELLLWLLRDKQFNNNYYAFGLNLEGKKQKDYTGRSEILRMKKIAEMHMKKSGGFDQISYDVLTKDKFVAYCYFTSNSIPCVPTEGVIRKNIIYYTNGDTSTLNELFKITETFVLKNVVLEAGDGFMLCKPNNNKLSVNQIDYNLEELKDKLGNAIWVFQKKISCHPSIAMVNNTALNTTRIVTIMNGSEPNYLTGFQSFATSGLEIDSWGKGAVYVGIDPLGSKLKPHGYYHPAVKNRSIAEVHPDSNILFKDFQIPFLKDAVDLCLKAHKLLYNHFLIGWDVVITDHGPVILEANEKPGMNAVQCIDGGLRNQINICFKNTINHLKTQK